MLFGGCNFSPFTFTKSFVDKQGALCSRACDDRAVLATVRGPHNVRRRGRLSTTGYHEALVGSGGNLLRIRCNAVVERERVAGSSEERTIFVDVEVFPVGKLRGSVC